MRIRPFQDKDIEQVIKIIEQNLELIKNTDKDSIKALKKFLTKEQILEKSKQHRLFVAHKAENILGLAGHTKTHIILCYVKPSESKKGIGTKLVNYVLNQMQDKGVKTVLANSTKFAQNFYLKNGFEKEKEITECLDNEYITYIKMRIELPRNTT
jgi:N-acetylglutamate synthase-like GNAT family acetyltransferase